jgi:hypothetical protein
VSADQRPITINHGASDRRRAKAGCGTVPLGCHELGYLDASIHPMCITPSESVEVPTRRPLAAARSRKLEGKVTEAFIPPGETTVQLRPMPLGESSIEKCCSQARPCSSHTILT